MKITKSQLRQMIKEEVEAARPFLGSEWEIQQWRTWGTPVEVYDIKFNVNPAKDEVRVSREHSGKYEEMTQAEWADFLLKKGLKTYAIDDPALPRGIDEYTVEYLKPTRKGRGNRTRSRQWARSEEEAIQQLRAMVPGAMWPIADLSDHFGSRD